MELKPAYKQTEVGVIPEDWDATTVGALISAGIIEKPLDGNHGNIHPKSGDFVDWGIPFVMANNVQSGAVDLVNCSFIRKEQADSLQKGFAKTGDVLLTHKATIGNTAVVGEIPFPYIMLTPQVTYYRVKDQTRLSNLYLRYYFDSWGFQSVLRSLSGGGTRAYIGISAQHQLPVVRPRTLPEQRAIAGALSDVDGLLGGLDRLIAKKRDLKQAAMQQLLTGQTRLPGFHGEWEVKKLGDVTDTDPENLGSDTHPSFSFNYISLEDVDQGTLKSHSEQMFRTAPSRARRKLRNNDVLVSTVRPNLKSHLLFRGDARRWVCSTGFCVVRCREKVTHPGYVFFHMFGHPVARQIEALLTGSNYPAINSGDVRALEIPFPHYDEQTAIAEALSDIDAELSALEQRREKTRNLKQAMMQELLTGKTRLV